MNNPFGSICVDAKAKATSLPDGFKKRIQFHVHIEQRQRSKEKKTLSRSLSFSVNNPLSAVEKSRGVLHQSTAIIKQSLIDLSSNKLSLVAIATVSLGNHTLFFSPVNNGTGLFQGVFRNVFP